MSNKTKKRDSAKRSQHRSNAYEALVGRLSRAMDINPSEMREYLQTHTMPGQTPLTFGMELERKLLKSPPRKIMNIVKKNGRTLNEPHDQTLSLCSIIRRALRLEKRKQHEATKQKEETK